MMGPEDELCLCFHVTRRKVENYIRIEKPRHVSQLAACHGAGTGCGWCRALLERLFRAAQDQGEVLAVELPDASQHARDRASYVRSGGGSPPPGAAPLDGGPTGDISSREPPD